MVTFRAFHESRLLAILSATLGWIYTFSWSASFYPQPILNIKRRSTTGTTIDFPFINVLGFTAYFVSNACFLYSPLIRNEYAERNKGLTPTVQFNDLAFAGHAVLLSLISLSQYRSKLWGFDNRSEKGRGGRISKSVCGVMIGGVIGVIAIAILVIARNDPDASTGWAWLDIVRLRMLFICIVISPPSILAG